MKQQPPKPSATDRRTEARWLDDNKAAIDDYNAYVARHGSFGDTHRRF